MVTGGRSAVVTGAAGGLGRALTRRLAAEGYRVIGLDRDVDGLERLARESDATTKVCDLADGAACERIADELGPVDLLINNAGITQFSRFDAMAPETLRQ
ncbi:MAG: SDR family NAD(P)-dependent oxidoreductase, partial [Alphaproteobacteria bacterium]|nr:SDR family NAD(P)-dependent oxidoreductase [Alphaproteobacteria bacterium]